MWGIDRRQVARDVRSHMAGFTLVEVLVAVPILLVAVLTTLAAATQHLSFIGFNRERTTAMNAAQGQLEVQINQGFEPLRQRVGDGQTVQFPLPEAGGLLPNLSFDAKGQLVIRDVDGQTGPVNVKVVNVVEVRVAVCWRSASGRIVGEDNGAGGGTALDGVLNGTEDANGNGLIDSPAVVVTRLARN